MESSPSYADLLEPGVRKRKKKMMGSQAKAQDSSTNASAASIAKRMKKGKKVY